MFSIQNFLRAFASSREVMLKIRSSTAQSRKAREELP
jgi:hypothetical protein